MKKITVLVALIISGSLTLSANNIAKEINTEVVNVEAISIKVNVTQNGQGVVGATVTVTSQGKTLGTGVSDMKGNANIKIAEYKSEVVDITTTMKDMQTVTLSGAVLKNNSSYEVKLQKFVEGMDAVSIIKIDNNIGKIIDKSEAKVENLNSKTEDATQKAEELKKETEESIKNKEASEQAQKDATAKKEEAQKTADENKKSAEELKAEANKKAEEAKANAEKTSQESAENKEAQAQKLKEYEAQMAKEKAAQEAEEMKKKAEKEASKAEKDAKDEAKDKEKEAKEAADKAKELEDKNQKT